MAFILWIMAHLSAWAVILLAAVGAGNLLLRRYDFNSLEERLAFTLATGLGLWALVFFILGLVGLLYREVIITLTVFGVIVCLIQFAASSAFIRLFEVKRWREYLRSPARFKLLFVAAALGYWALLFQRALYPPLVWDATAYHLVLAREYLTAHRLVVHEGIILPVVPALNHMLFTWALAIQDDLVAQLLEQTLMLITALALYAWGKRQHRPLFGVAAAAFWLGHPLVLMLGESAYVDVGITCFVFLGIYALRRFWDEHQAAWWYLGLALLDMAAGIKMPGLFFAGLAASLGLWAWMKSYLKRQELLAGWLLVAALATPWYAFIAYHASNPFWPAFARLSHGEWFVGAETVWRTWGNVGVPKTFLNFLSLPVRLTLTPDLFFPDNNRSLLPLVLVFPLAWIMAIFNRSVRWWTFWALAYTAFWFLSSQQLRFWLIALPFVGLAMYESLDWLVGKLGKPRALPSAIWLSLTLFALVYGFRPGFGVMKIKHWPPPITEEQREDFLTRLYVGYKGVRYINQHAEPGEAVYALNGSWLNYYFKPRIIDTAGMLQLSGRPTFRWPEDEPWVRKMEANNVKWIFMNVANAPPMVAIPKRNPVTNPFWPDYEIVYADSTTWVFRHKPIPPENF
ncbi:MAG: glycosyltransferase family 39 protein [Acidobacteria bacterium]|nr:glycosyltransferase family 39 protein [Acidobacteriota bacterium]